MALLSEPSELDALARKCTGWCKVLGLLREPELSSGTWDL